MHTLRSPALSPPSQRLITGAKKQLLETQRMQDLSHNKRKLHKVQKRKDIKERKKSEKSAPPLRLGV